MRDNLVQVSLSSQFWWVCVFKWLIILSLSLWNRVLAWLAGIPVLGGGHGNSLQYTCLKNPHGQGSLANYSPWSHKELDTIEQLSTFCSRRWTKGLWAGCRQLWTLWNYIQNWAYMWISGKLTHPNPNPNPNPFFLASDPSRWFGPKGIMNHCCLKTERVAINNKSFKFYKCSKLTLSHTSDLKLGKWTFISSQNDKYLIPLNIHLHNGWKYYIKMLGFERLIN